MIKKTHYLFIVLFCVVGWVKADDWDEKYNFLCDAYQTLDYDKLDLFFNEWYQKSTPISKEEFAQLSKVHKATYNLYHAFYYPFGIDDSYLSKDDKKHFNSNPDSLEEFYLPYKAVEYIVIQNHIDIKVASNIWEILKPDFSDAEPNIVAEDSVITFRPNLKLKNKKVLYLTDKYDSSITRFIDGHFNIFQQPDTLAHYKLQFLKKKIWVLPGHWGGIHIETLPLVQSIVYNKQLWLAKVYFRATWYSGGDALYVRLGNKWFEIYKRENWWE